MNENISHNFFIWEEKNSTEPQKNYENKNASETKDTTNDTQTNVENLHWKDITNPKERQKAYKKAYAKDWYKDNKDKIKAYKEANKDRIKEKNKIYRESNKVKMRKKKWYKAHKDKLRVKYKNYYKDNKEKIIVKSKAYAKANKDKIFSYKKTYREVNKDKLKIEKSDYYKDNKDKINTLKKTYCKNKRKTDIQFRLSCNLRSRLKSAIKNNQKAGSAVKDLGCTVEQLKQYLESKFQPEMTWDNWTVDGWHIDHIKPLSSFDLTDRNQLLEACHYTNLQPLWAKDNIIKSDKIINV
jgi:hypothetical protein